MDTKLTLKLNADVIARAKEYASQTDISLSRIVEKYLDAITAETSEEPEIDPLVKSLTGVVQLDADFDYKKANKARLSSKYGL